MVTAASPLIAPFTPNKTENLLIAQETTEVHTEVQRSSLSLSLFGNLLGFSTATTKDTTTEAAATVFHTEGTYLQYMIYPT